MNIWQRYFYKEYLFTIIFLLFSIYGLYVIVDIMAHLKVATDSKSSLLILIEYYLSTFSKRLDVLIPFSILIATIRTLYNFQSKGELVAMLASGISRLELLKPFLIVAASFSLLLYANYEWVLPSALSNIATIAETRFGKEQDSFEIKKPQEVMLQDGSKLIYSSFKRSDKTFHDVFWIRSADSIFHMKTLSCSGSPPCGKWVDEITRNSSGLLETTRSVENYDFKDMRFDLHALKNSIVVPQELSLWELVKQSWLYFDSSSPRAAEVKAYLVYKLTFPWMCLLAFIAPAPFCMRFTRMMPILMTYLVAIAGLFCMSILLQTALSIARHQLLAPYFAIGIPWLVALYYFGKPYLRL